MILGLVDEATTAGARQGAACALLGIDPRTVQRWRRQGVGEDRRAGPRTRPANRLSDGERPQILRTVNATESCSLSSK